MKISSLEKPKNAQKSILDNLHFYNTDALSKKQKSTFYELGADRPALYIGYKQSPHSEFISSYEERDKQQEFVKVLSKVPENKKH